MAIATLSVDLIAQLAKFEQNMDKAARIAERSADASSAAWANAGKKVAALGGAVAGLFAGYSLVDIVRSNIDAIDSFNDMQDATGSTIEKLSGLVDMAKRTGHSQEDATALIVKLNAALNETEDDSKTSRALRAIGVSADDLRRADPVDALQQVAKALGRYADDGNRARLVQELFGKSARELAPLLKDLADSGEIVATVTSEQADQADKFNKELAKLSTNISDTARSITADLIPALNSMFDSVKKKGVGGSFLSWLGFDDKFDQTRALAKVAKAVNDLEFERKTLVEATTKDSNNADQERRLARLKQIVDVELPKAKEAFRKADAEMAGRDRDENYGHEGRGSEKPTVGQVPDKPKKEKKGKTERDEMAESPPVPDALKAALDRIQESDIAKAAKLREELDALMRLEREPGVDKGAVADAITKVTEELEKVDPEAKKAAESQKRLKEMLDATSGSQLEKTRKDMELLTQAFLDGKLSVEQYEQAVNQRLNGEAKKALDEMGEFAKQAARNIQDELGDTLERLLSGNFDGILKSWENLIIRMVAQAAAAKLGKVLFGDFDKTGEVGGVAGDWWSVISKGIGSFFGGFADGGAFGPAGQIRAFAKGDLFSSPTMFGFGGGQMGVMGEAGPEAVMPLKRGPDGRLGVAASGGGSSRTTVQIFNQGAPVSASSTTERQPDGSQLVKVFLNAWSEDMVSGGVTARATTARFPQLKG